MSTSLSKGPQDCLKTLPTKPSLVTSLRVLSLVVVLSAIVLLFTRNARAQAAGTLPDYVPLLPQVQAKATAVDPKKGYAVKELKPGIFMITDGAYESVFATTGNGVVLFDAPPSLEILAEDGTAEFLRQMHDPHGLCRLAHSRITIR